MRRRRSASSSSGTSTWKGRISVALSIVAISPPVRMDVGSYDLNRRDRRVYGGAATAKRSPSQRPGLLVKRGSPDRYKCNRRACGSERTGLQDRGIRGG